MGWQQVDDVVMVIFRQIFRLNTGNYLLSVGVQTIKDGKTLAYDILTDYIAFQVVSNAPRFGIFDNESEIEWFVCK